MFQTAGDADPVHYCHWVTDSNIDCSDAPGRSLVMQSRRYVFCRDTDVVTTLRKETLSTQVCLSNRQKEWSSIVSVLTKPYCLMNDLFNA